MRLAVGPGSSMKVGDQVAFSPAQGREQLRASLHAKPSPGTPSVPPASSPQVLSLTGLHLAHPPSWPAPRGPCSLRIELASACAHLPSLSPPQPGEVPGTQPAPSACWTAVLGPCPSPLRQ